MSAATPTLRLWVPRDSAALAVGADAVADALQSLAARQGVPLALVRNGSRGLLWLETLVEVDTPHGRVAFGPVEPADVEALWPALRAEARGEVSAHPLRQGLAGQIPSLALQERLTFARVGVTDPLSLDDYAAHGGWAGLRTAVGLDGAAILHEVTHSGLRGRGGAAFPAGIKWKTVAHAAGATKYVVCNADEGDSGTFADRMLMEGDPYLLIEGMAIAALAVGATAGYVYVRSEYPQAAAVLTEAVARAQAAGWLGDDVAGSGRAFHLHVRLGAGSYVCGEETAMLESLEGRRGIVRAKPPLPAVHGLFGCPTVINNVLTFAAVPTILARGADFYRGYGVGRSHGTLGCLQADGKPEPKPAEPPAAKHRWKRISYPAILSWRKDAITTWENEGSRTPITIRNKGPEGMELSFFYYLPSAYEQERRGESKPEKVTADLFRNKEKPLKLKGALETHAYYGSGGDMERREILCNHTFVIPWGPNGLDDGWVRLRLLRQGRSFWVELPYGFTRNPNDPPAPARMDRNRPSFPSVEKSFGDVVIPWESVTYELEALKPGEAVQEYERRMDGASLETLKKRSGASLTLSNPFYPAAELTLTGLYGPVQEPRSAISLGGSEGRCISLAILEINGLTRSQMFRWGTMPSEGRQWCTVRITVNNEERVMDVPSSLIFYSHGHAEADAHFKIAEKWREYPK